MGVALLEPLVRVQVQTPVGPLWLVACDASLVACLYSHQMVDGGRFADSDSVSLAQSPILQQAAMELEEYFGGVRRSFETPLRFAGTEFQQQVWSSLRSIPWGSTWSYTQQSSFLGRPSAVRAVARANSQNRLNIFVPCHRVIGASGGLRGYSGGIHAKAFLLAHEGGMRPLTATTLQKSSEAASKGLELTF